MPSRRVAVMSPQTRHAHARGRLRGRWRVPTLDPADADRAQVIFQAQRRHAVAPLLLLFAGMLGLPLVFALFPGLDEVRLAGIPLSWLVLAVLPYPALVLLARWQLRRAERIEDESSALLRPDRDQA
ncbi:hypothetical protein [Actinophytocola sp.]|uniref:hypothetical protein n=1 Tax=Actinophytocola sp. TaxID=1872138 RepID=UPI0039C86611